MSKPTKYPHIPELAGVYAISCRATGAEYVGSTRNLRKRWVSHLSALRNRHAHMVAAPLLASVCEHGLEAHEFVVLELCCVEELLSKEQHYIATRLPALNTKLTATPWTLPGRAVNDATRELLAERFRIYEVQGVRGSICSLAKHFGLVSEASVRKRMKDGWTLSDAVLTPRLRRKPEPA